MTAPSPDQLVGDRISFTIKANGKSINSSYQVKSIDVWLGVNRMPKARLVISDGDPAAETFPISQTTDFIPGASLEIALGYDGTERVVFSGVVYRQGIDVSTTTASRLMVEATDKAMVMTLARRNALFENMTDSQVASKLIQSAGLEASVTATQTVYPTIVQYYASDWDLLVMRAQLNSMVVTVDSAKVSIGEPDTSKEPVLTLTYGDSILAFRADMDASTQYSAAAIQSFAWNPADQALAQSGHATASVTEPGNLSSAQLAEVFGVSPYTQQTSAGLSTSDLTTWSSAELLRSQLAKIRGELRFLGCTLAEPGVMITLAGLGDRFNGPAYVSSVHHRVEGGLWRTTAELGLAADWFAARAPEIAAPETSGQLPPISSLQIGKVLKIDGDPEGEFRVQVSLPMLQASGGAGIWARLGGIYASSSFGIEFYPEQDDEVIVGFMDNDPRYPVILGSLYSKTRSPPVVPAAANNTKTIVTKSKLRLDFFEDGPAVEISTPGKQSIRLDDATKTVTIKDMNGNVATLAPSGITLDSAAEMTLKAKGSITVSAGANLSLKAAANVSIDGAQIQATAETSFAAAGRATSKLTSSGIVIVQGALVKIN